MGQHQTYQHSCYRGSQKEKKGRKRQKTYLKKKMAENFLNLEKETDIQIQES